MPLYDSNLIIPALLGAWKPNISSIWGSRLYNVYAVIVTLIHFVFTLSQFGAIVFETTRSIPELSEKLAVGLIMFMGFAKRLNFLVYQKEIMRITTMLGNLRFAKATNEDEHEIKKKYKRLAKWTTIVAIGFYISPTVYIIQKLNTSHFPVTPLSLGLPYNITNHGTYKIIGLYQVTFYFVSLLSGCNFLLFFVNMMMMNCTQVAVLRDRCEKMVNNLDNPGSINEEKKIIIDFVEKHLEVLELTKKINELFAIIIFLQFSYSSIVICLTAYISSATAIFSAKFFTILFVMLRLIFEIGTICLASDEVTIQFEAIFHTLYNVNWVDFHAHTKRSMIILMTRTSRPFIFKCAKLFAPSRESFTNILKLSYSIYNVLRQ